MARLFIASEYLDSESKETTPVKNPATGEIVDTVPKGTVSDIRRAIDVAARAEGFELLLTDVKMPKMSGNELARRLRQNEPGLKVLYLTGFSDYLFHEKTTLWEDEAYLDKPCSLAGLRQAVSLLLVGRVEAPSARCA